MNQLEQLKKFTTVVADTGDFESLRRYSPMDSTTNPSLILAAAQKPQYAHLIEDAVLYGRKHNQNSLLHALDKLVVNFGLEILKIVPGRVSTEVDARLSFDVEASITKTKTIIKLYESSGIPRERILIKLASTWEGIIAASRLEKEGIHCNMTLLFSLPQAVAAAEAKATLISPFVGRILDWYKKEEGKTSYPASEDPGVLSVRQIYHYYKKFGYNTEIMGASFRNKEEILELAGCDLLTIAPSLLEELQSTQSPSVSKKLDPDTSQKESIHRMPIDEKIFRYKLNENAMATEKLSEGIRNFVKDIEKLEAIVEKKLST